MVQLLSDKMVSRIINQKLLPELRKLGIPCPDETHDVLQPSTEYHSFTIHSSGTTLFISEILLGGGAATDWPGNSRSMMGPIDVDRKEFNLANPSLFDDALKFITERWKWIQYFEDCKIIDYIETHSKSKLALFNRRDLNRLLMLAGHKPNMELEWASLPYYEAMKYINKARENLDYHKNTTSVS